MNRKEFLITVWIKCIKPILLIGIIFFCGKFFYNVFRESGTERFMTLLTLALGMFMLTMYLIGLLFKSLIEKINSILPESIKFWIRIINKFLNYIMPIISGMIVYYFWREDKKIVAIVLVVLLIQQIVKIIREQKKRLQQ